MAGKSLLRLIFITQIWAGHFAQARLHIPQQFRLRPPRLEHRTLISRGDIAQSKAWRGFPRPGVYPNANSVTFGTVAAIRVASPSTRGKRSETCVMPHPACRLRLVLHRRTRIDTLTFFDIWRIENVFFYLR